MELVFRVACICVSGICNSMLSTERFNVILWIAVSVVQCTRYFSAVLEWIKTWCKHSSHCNKPSVSRIFGLQTQNGSKKSWGIFSFAAPFKWLSCACHCRAKAEMQFLWQLVQWRQRPSSGVLSVRECQRPKSPKDGLLPPNPVLIELQRLWCEAADQADTIPGRNQICLARPQLFLTTVTLF